MEFATSSFFSSSNIVPGVCSWDTTEVLLGFLSVTKRACENRMLNNGFRHGKGDGNQLLTNMQPNCGRAVRSSDVLKRLQHMLRNQVAQVDK